MANLSITVNCWTVRHQSAVCSWSEKVCSSLFFYFFYSCFLFSTSFLFDCVRFYVINASNAIKVLGSFLLLFFIWFKRHCVEVRFVRPDHANFQDHTYCHHHVYSCNRLQLHQCVGTKLPSQMQKRNKNQTKETGCVRFKHTQLPTYLHAQPYQTGPNIQSGHENDTAISNRT